LIYYKPESNRLHATLHSHNGSALAHLNKSNASVLKKLGGCSELFFLQRESDLCAAVNAGCLIGALASVNGLVVYDTEDAVNTKADTEGTARDPEEVILRESVLRKDDSSATGDVVKRLNGMEWGFVLAKAAWYGWRKLNVR
jgi:hypothetical protein